MVTGVGGAFGDDTEIGLGDSVEHTFDDAGVSRTSALLHRAPSAGAEAATGGGGNLAGVVAGAASVLTVAGIAAARRR